MKINNKNIYYVYYLEHREFILHFTYTGTYKLLYYHVWYSVKVDIKNSRPCVVKSIVFTLLY